VSKILLLDIETFPNVGYAWGMYEQNLIAIKEHWSICSYSAKWLGGEHVTRGLPDSGTEQKLVSELWRLLDEADVVIAHNGDQFDLKKINARLLVYESLPPAPYRTIDTKKIAKRLFGFTCNRLDDLCQQLGLGKKMRHEGFELWLGCMENESAPWTKMKMYNQHDVVLLERLYLRMLPWINNHPNVSKSPIGCPKCGSTHLQSRGTARSKSQVYDRYQCQDCGGWARDTKSTVSHKIING
jgi:hypothetical protein